GAGPAQDIEAGHADGDSHLNLLMDHAARYVVGHDAVDLHASIHWPRVHDERIRSGRLQLLLVEAIKPEIFADRRDEAALHSLGLETQHHDDVYVAQPLAHVVKDFDAHAVDRSRQQ